MIDLVCHLGSRFGYATHATWVAAALHARGQLNRIVNLDDMVHPDHERWLPHLVRPRGDRVLVISGIFGLDTFGRLYGQDNAALFLCPNTDRLSTPMAEASNAYGYLLAPSVWCAKAVEAATGRTPTVLPLGIDPAYLEARLSARAALRSRLASPPRFLHLSTDGFWPGRKGTQELLTAWASLKAQGALGDAKLTLHVTAQNEHVVYYGCLDRGLEAEALALRTAPPRGSTVHELIWLMTAHDGIVLPTRCEGFGMQALAAHVLGLPLLTTCHTGHLMFLDPKEPDFIAILTGQMGELAGEEGMAPTVPPADIERGLLQLLPTARRAELLAETFPRPGARLVSVVEGFLGLRLHSWDVVADQWADVLEHGEPWKTNASTTP